MNNIISGRCSDEISIVSWNIRSLVRNLKEFKNHFGNYKVKPDLIAVHETKITETVKGFFEINKSLQFL